MSSPTRILLFTPFAPTQGGGSQNLRGALPHLNDIEVTWAYLAQKPVIYPNSIHLGIPMLQGNLVATAIEFAAMSTGRHKGIKKLAQKLIEIKENIGAGRIWTVAHYEALSVADELISQGANIHLSIHDDPPSALTGRSRRYFFLQGLCEAQFTRVLKGSTSVDVTSYPMGERYKERYGVSSVAYFPYISAMPAMPPAKEDGALRVGFLGTLYTARETNIFAQALAKVAKRTRQTVEWHFWGLGARQQAWVKDLAAPTFIHPFTPEENLINELAPMKMLYVNYPFDTGSRIFSQTSHCAKLSSYLKAQRPLFAHTPLPSSIADFVRDTATGLVCNSMDTSQISRAVELLSTTPIPAVNYTKARDKWYGEENLNRLRSALLQIK